MKKVDSSVLAMDSKETSAIAERCPLFSKEAMLCHALPCKARNDRETPKAQNVICKKVDRILGFLMRKRGCAGFCAEISLDGYRTNKRQAPCFIAKRQNPKPKSVAKTTRDKD